MSEALVQVGDIDPDPTAGRPRHGDVIDIRPDGSIWGGKEMEGRRIVRLFGEPSVWLHLLQAGQEEHGTAPLFRRRYLDDNDAVREREIAPLVLH